MRCRLPVAHVSCGSIGVVSNITQVVPSSGPATGGVPITLYGTGLTTTSLLDVVTISIGGNGTMFVNNTAEYVRARTWVVSARGGGETASRP